MNTAMGVFFSVDFDPDLLLAWSICPLPMRLDGKYNLVHGYKSGVVKVAQDQSLGSVVARLLTLIKRWGCSCGLRYFVIGYDLNEKMKRFHSILQREITPLLLSAFEELIMKKCYSLQSNKNQKIENKLRQFNPTFKFDASRKTDPSYTVYLSELLYYFGTKAKNSCYSLPWEGYRLTWILENIQLEFYRYDLSPSMLKSVLKVEREQIPPELEYVE